MMNNLPPYTFASIDALKPYLRNARTHSNKQIGQIADSIKEFGFINPVLIDGNKQIIAGHGRVLAAQLIGMVEVPTLRFDHLCVKDKHLIINENESVTVRRLFDFYLEIKSVWKLKKEADALGIVTKHRHLRDGRLQGGKSFSRGNLYQLLSDPVYIGKVRHHGETYPGQHKRIINQEIWDGVQALMSSNAVNRASETNAFQIGYGLSRC